jgi:probable HAF family extracellular repeat protein
LGVLGTLDSVANAINDSGQIVGYNDNVNGAVHAFLWTQSGGMQDMNGSQFSTFATAINASGQMAGFMGATKDSSWRAAFWANSTTVRELPTLGGTFSEALGLNDAGQVVGLSFISVTSGPGHAFLWSRTAGIQDLGTLGGDRSGALSINASGQVVGWADLPGHVASHAFLWTKSRGMHDLGTLGGVASTANAINKSGTVVGWSYLADYTQHAFVRTSSGGMQDLNSLIPSNSGWVLINPTGINASGQIVGSGTLNRFYHGFLLTPAGQK